MKNVTKIQIKKAELEVYEALLNELDQLEKGTMTDFRIIGTSDEQETDWRTGELKWEDEEKTIPKYRSIWGDVELTEDEMSEERIAKRKAIASIRAAIEKMI